MRKLCLLIMLFLVNGYAHSQPLAVDSVQIRKSECYNTGSILFNVSGGTNPYSLSVTTGPALPNITYPVYPDSGSYFANLHAGNYTAQITDGTGSVINFRFTIPGNYQFPHLTTTLSFDTIFALATSGKPPYLYSLSTVGVNGPYANIQDSGRFVLCNGTYYVRVTDSCGNFYTSQPVYIHQNHLITNSTCDTSGSNNIISTYIPDYTYGHPPFHHTLINGNYTSSNTTGIFIRPANSFCADTIYTIDRCNDTAVVIADCHPLKADFCSNFSDSSAQITVSGGCPPFRYQFYAYDSITHNTLLLITQDSGYFAHLPYPQLSTIAIFKVTDSCGRALTLTDAYLDFKADNECPFNGKLEVNSIVNQIGTYPIISCISCVPVKTLIPPERVFTGLDTGNYTIRITDQCGETRDKTFHIADTLPIKLKNDFTSCNDVQVKAFSSGGEILTSGVTFILSATSSGVISDTNTAGIFLNLGTDVYNITAHYDGCYDAGKTIYIPQFSGYCTTPYLDTACQLKTIVTYATPDLAEHYQLIAQDGSRYYETPPDDSDGIYFDIVPGRYTLKSDSGCEVNQEFGYNARLGQQHWVNCINRGTVALYVQLESNSICVAQHPFIYSLQNIAGTFFTPQTFNNDTAMFYDLDTGIYMARTYLQDYIVTLARDTVITGNARCVLDSMPIQISPHIVPHLKAENLTVCGSTALGSIPFIIQDGIAPFTISLSGYPNVYTTDRLGTIPGLPIGNYTLITSDTCGISSSLNIGVIDSCINCDTIHATFTASDTLFCTGDILRLQAIDTTGLHYKWIINNQDYGDSTSITFAANAASGFNVSCIARRFACYDTATKFIQLSPLPAFSLGNDTILCPPIMFPLYSGFSATQWSTGETGTGITALLAGLYVAEVSSRCGAYTDSVKIEEERCEGNIHVPGAFTPNGDGTNDYLTVFGDNISSYEIKIYNRWGELVYHSTDATELNDLSRGWNGTLNNTLQSAGAFAYYIIATGNGGQQLEKKGNVTLIR